METIRYTEKKKSTKWPAVITVIFLVIGGAFVAYGIKFEDNPRMLGFSNVNTITDTNALENVESTDEEKLQQVMNLNYEIKEVTSEDKTTPSYVSDIHLPNIYVDGLVGKAHFQDDGILVFSINFDKGWKIYVDGKELTEIDAKISEEYTTRFENVKNAVSGKTESNYSFNVSYKYYDNIVGTKKVVSIIVDQQIVDTDSNKSTSRKVTTYNIDLASKSIITQADVLVDLLGKDYKDLIKSQVKDYVISNKLISESKYNYEITYLENFYIQDGVFHIVFNMDSDPIVNDSKGVLDIEINKED